MFKFTTLAILAVNCLDMVICFPSYGLHQNLPLASSESGGLGNYGHNGYAAQTYQESSVINNDHHGGVSIVGAGGSGHKGTMIDLTKQGGPGHDGLFGGSFISSGKHDSYLQGHEGGHDLGAQYQSYHAAGEVTPVHYSGSEHGSPFGAHSDQFENLKNQEFSSFTQQETHGNYNFGHFGEHH